MVNQAPNSIDIQDFQFKLHCRLKVFSSDDKSFEKHCDLLANAGQFGLIFIGTNTPAFKVIQISNIEALTQKENDETAYKSRTISLPSKPTHLSVNCDSTKLVVVVEKNGCIVAVIYDVSSFLRKDISIIQEIRLSTSPGVHAVQTTWNPTLPNVFTACKSDGTLGVYEFKETGIDINELPAESQALCMCWSPKGKQIAVGSVNGKITQYKPDLKAMKVINAPPLDGSYSVVAIQWISSFQFIAIYKCTSSDSGSTLLVVDAPKTGDVSYTNYEDICYSYGNARPVQFYTIHEPLWNILVVASSNSMEVGVLGNEKEQWIQWTLADSARAELPLSSSKQETLPVGLVLDKSAVEPIVWGEHLLPPAPFLFLLSHHGLLCCFRMINIKNGVSSICQAPESFQDTSGLNSFVASVNVAPKVPALTSEAPKPKFMQTPPAPQISQPTPPKEVSQPIKEMTFNSQPFAPSTSSSMFGTTISKSETTIKPGYSTKSVPVNSEAAQTYLVPTKTLSTSATIPTPATTVSTETKIDQEETDLLISKLIREECETLEKELKALLHKGSLIKVDLGTDGEAVKLVQDTDSIQNFLTEVIETSTVQAAEVHSLKQGLIQTWAWYEDARSRYQQIQDSTLDSLFRIQQLDPVSQRYMADIKYLTYYLESQLVQASRVQDEQWENFQDSCKKISRLKIPTVETIYQTMVRQSAIYQKQKYVLKDISSRIRAQRGKINGRSLLVSLNNVEQLEKDLLQLQLDPSNILCAQFERVLETQKKLTPLKIKKLEKLLSDKEITHISVNKPQLSNTSLYTLLNNSAAKLKQPEDMSVLGAALSPISSNKLAATNRVIDFVQSTPKTAVTIPAKTEKVQDFDKPVLAKTFQGATSIFADSTPGNQDNKTAYDFSANLKKSFTFGPQSSESLGKFSVPQSTTFTTKTETTTSFSSQSTVTTSSTSQFSFGSVSTPSFFGTTKPVNTATKLNAPVIAATAAEVSKPISSTSSSAFVPTTQLAFTFTAKSNTTTTPFLTNLSTKSSHTAFTSLAPDAEIPKTPTSPKTDPFASSVFPKTVLPQSTPSTTSSLLTPTINTSVTSIPLSKSTTAVTPTTTAPAHSTNSEKSMNLFSTTSAFSFSNTETPSNIFTVKTANSQENQSSNSQSTSSTSSSIFSFAAKTTPQASIFGSTTKPAFSFSGTTTTSSKSLFSPVVASESSTSTVAEADSTSAAKQASLFSIPTISASIGVSSAPTTSAVSVTTSIFTSVTTTASIFGNASSNIFGNKATTVTTPSVTKSVTTSTSTVNASIFGNKITTTASSTPVIFGNTTITTVKPTLSVFETTTTITTTSAGFEGLPTTTLASTTTTTSIFGLKPTTSTSLFGSTTPTTTTPLFGLTTSTASAQTQSTSTASVTTATTTSSGSAFGVPPTTATIFGATTTTTTSTSVFGAAPAFGTTANSVFGQPTTTASLFSAPKPSIFGEPLKTGSSPFGTQTNTFENTSPVFGAAPVFSTPASTSGSIFGSANASTPTFGSGGSIFGNTPTTNTGFAQSPTSSFSFSAAAANIPSTGFSKPAFGFGASPNTDGSSFSFNSLNMGASTTTANTSFGQSPTANPFSKSTTQQDQKPAFAGGSLFGISPSTTGFGGGSSSIFGNSNTQTFGVSSGFGSNPTFGQTQSFGQPAFGSSFTSPQQSAPFSSGAGQSVAQSGFGAFGQAQKSPGFGAAPVFGGSPGSFGASPSFGGTAPAFGSSLSFGSPSKVFGDTSTNTANFAASTQQNSTFANLATQNTIGFGALAQQSPTLPTSTPFQSSSFSTWR